MMGPRLFVVCTASYRDCRGFVRNSKRIKTHVPLSLNPPQESDALIPLIEDLWIKEQLATYGMGTENIMPEIAITAINYREIR